MELRTDVIDVWVFRRGPDGVRYLLLHTSQEKADRWFGGGRFWQIPGAFPVFAAEVGHTGEMRLGWEHSEATWCTSDECRQRLTFRGLLEGLDWVRRYITENEAPRPEFRLA
jgi:hypothetical protein